MHHSSKAPLLILLTTILTSALLGACSNQTAEEKGKAIATEKADMVKGIGDAMQEKGTAAAESLTTGLGKVVQGVERGVEKSKRTVVVSDAARQAGLDVTKVQFAETSMASSVSASEPEPEAARQGLDIYLISQKAAEGELKVKVLNALDQEIGRAKLAIKQGADEAQYVRIPMPDRVDLHAVSKVHVDFQATPAASTQPVAR
jgi:hypothetical protein